MAMFVVANHLHPLDKIIIKDSLAYNLYEFIIPLAVPFFYLTTGFFLGKKIKNIKEIDINDYSMIKKNLIKLIKLYVIFTIIYLPLTIYGFEQVYNMSVLKSLLSFFRNFIFIGENYNSWILWYILSEIYGLLIIYMLKNKINNNNYLMIIGTMLFSLGLIINVFNGLSFESSFMIIIQKCIKLIIPNGRILNSLLFISLGIFISKNEIIRKKTVYILSVFVLLVFSTFVNITFINNICRVFLSYILFKFIINTNFKYQKIADYCKIASKDFYFWHLYIFSLIQLFIEGKINNTYELRYFCFTIVILLIISLLHFSFKNNKKIHKQTING